MFIKQIYSVPFLTDKEGQSFVSFFWMNTVLKGTNITSFWSSHTASETFLNTNTF